MTDNDQQPNDYDLTCWYINSRRVFELVGAQGWISDAAKIEAVGTYADIYKKNAMLALLKDQVVTWLQKHNPPTLGQLITEGNLRPGQIFTHYSNYYFRGLPKVSEALRNGKSPIPMAGGYAKLDSFEKDLRVEFSFHHEHLTSSSAWEALMGQSRLLVIGLIKDVQPSLIQVTPVVIANPFPGIFGPTTLISRSWPQHLEVHVDSIDNFTKIRDHPIRPLKSNLNLLRDIPESDVKEAIADIIGEPTVPKDWGGEKSDLFSSYVQIDGRRISTAFAFKGPAKFSPMQMTHLGKNGDQISRLFTEPADLLVLQHCHEITTPVRDAMRAYAQRMGQLRLFCLIDGYDTYRILKAYGKCGLNP